MRALPLAIGAMGLLMVLRLSALSPGPGTPSVLASAGRAVLPPARAATHEAPAAAPVAPAPEPVAAEAAPAVPAASEAEMALLQDLRARRATLDSRAQALETREAVLQAAERRLSERVQQLQGMQTRLEAMDATRRERDEANWRSLVKTYETMRPRDAATIFNELDPAVLMPVLDRMKEAKAGLVLAAMQPDRARAATTDLAKWRTRAPAGAQP